MTRRYEFVSFDEITGEATVRVRAGWSNGLLAVLSIVTISAVVGAGLAAMATPAIADTSVVVGRAVDYWDSLPTTLPVSDPLPQHTILLDKNGSEFARFYSENRVDVTFKQISPTFLNALVATEDSRFYTEPGVDLQGILRAAIGNLASGSKEGASTITQQLVKNILISDGAPVDGRTYGEKIREVKYATALSKSLSKRDILTAYSNAVFLGNKAYGIQSAALTYFNTDASKLTVPQSALLVALLKSPIEYDPFVHPAAAKQRRDTVIGRMLAEGYLTTGQAVAAKEAPVTLVRGSIPSGCGSSIYPYYCALVRGEILSNAAFGATPAARAETLRRGGLTITTALDPKAMVAAQTAATGALGNDNRVAAGVAVVIPGTGHIAAIGQNRTWDQTQIIYAESLSMPGSSMKPITLATALEQGIPITTRFNVSGPYFPKSMDSPSSGFHNDSSGQRGVIDASRAVKESVNIYFIKLIEKAGVLQVAAMAKRLGINSLPRMSGREASLTLGTFVVTPVDMATAYATFASGGVKCNPIAIVSAVRTSGGNPVATPDADCHQEIDSSVAAQVDGVLAGPLQPGGTLGAVGALEGRPTGAKTGTTDNSSSNWTVGITPQFSTAVWIGDPRGGVKYPLKNVSAFGHVFASTFGASVAGPIWKGIMAALHIGLPVAGFPVANGAAIRVATTQMVPNVRGLTVGAAAAVLEDAGFTPSISSKTAANNPVIMSGVVTVQAPAAGTTANAGNKNVLLTLSYGSDTHVKISSRR